MEKARTGEVSDITCLDCNAKMRILTHRKLKARIDVCPNDLAVWFDSGEAEAYLEWVNRLYPDKKKSLTITKFESKVSRWPGFDTVGTDIVKDWANFYRASPYDES
jgi:Zn-finger nucleic acid-binding protein